jgi:(R,R)-butanediol dehydrogenase/meso-butanediol dehydrogenase/diacetyl reductase
MRAAVFIKPGEPLQLQELPDPEPGAGEVVLKICRCGVCATDLSLTEGAFAQPAGFVPGHERGCEVVAVGRGVERLKVGDHVTPHSGRGCGRCAECLAGTPYFCAQTSMNMGGFAQYMACHEVFCAKLPGALSMADAALVEPLAVGLLGARINPIEVGANVAVMGAGPMGLASIFWARRAGAGKIAAIATSRQREGFARAMGADAFLTTGDDLVGELTEQFGGGLPDVVYECAGAPGALERCVQLVRPRGSVTVLGLCTHADTWTPGLALLKEVKLQFAVGSRLSDYVLAAETLAAGHVEPRQMVTETVSLQRLPDLFESLRGPNPHAKVLVDPWLEA